MAKSTAAASPTMEFGGDTELPKTRRTSKYDALIEQLRANPGQVGKLGPLSKDASGIATLLKDRGAEAVTRTVDGATFVYARWPLEGESSES